MASPHRISNSDKVKVAYRSLLEEDKEALCYDTLTLDQVVSIEESFRKHGLTISGSLDALKLCVFDTKTEVCSDEENKSKKNSNNHEICLLLYAKYDIIHGDLISPIGGISIAREVGNDQFAFFVAGLNYAHSVGRDQFTIIGVGLNYAHSVSKDQAVYIGGAINIADEVLGSQYTTFGCAINVAKRVGKGQYGLVNVVTEELKGRQVGVINYAAGETYKQYGLLNFRPGKRWWNPEVSLFYHNAKKREIKKAEKQLKRISQGLETARIEEPLTSCIETDDSCEDHTLMLEENSPHPPHKISSKS